jgi:hypothetical protein
MKTVYGALTSALMCVALMSSLALAEEAPATGASPTATPATPATPPSENTAANATAPKGDDEIVCKKEPPPIGSRMGGRKVCRTVAEWRRIQAAAKETTDEIQSRKVPEPAS